MNLCFFFRSIRSMIRVLEIKPSLGTISKNKFLSLERGLASGVRLKIEDFTVETIHVPIQVEKDTYGREFHFAVPTSYLN